MLHDETRKLLIEAWNKTHNAKEIYIYRFSSIEFKQVRIPDISTDCKLFWSFRFLRNV